MVQKENKTLSWNVFDMWKIKLLDIIPAKRKFSFRTKDMKSILNSKWWNDMHDEIELKYCDYPNHDCIKVKELSCGDCGVYKRKLGVKGK